MKRTILALTILLTVCFAQTSPAKALNPHKTPAVTSGGGDWKKAKNNSWPGLVDGQTYWYKLDASAKLLWSADGKIWETDSDGMWTDKEGSFFKIDGRKVVWSPDAGNTWSDTPEWKWQAIDGQWYKLDKDWAVWVKKDAKKNP